MYVQYIYMVVLLSAVVRIGKRRRESGRVGVNLRVFSEDS